MEKRFFKRLYGSVNYSLNNLYVNNDNNTMSNDKQQTAVDSIIEFCHKQMDNDSSIHKGVYLSIIKFCKEEGKIIHELQITAAYKAAMHTQYLESHTVTRYGTVHKADDYYNKTYGDGVQ